MYKNIYKYTFLWYNLKINGCLRNRKLDILRWVLIPYEKGWREDKDGNIFEDNYVIEKLLDIIEEKVEYITIEPISIDEVGVDVIVFKDKIKSLQQCKERNKSKETWTFGDMNAKRIFTKLQEHL